MLAAPLHAAPGGGMSSPDPAPLQSTSLTLTTDRPGSATGLTARIDFLSSRPWVRPYSVRQIGVQFPPGFGVDFAAAPVCRASDAELYLRGAQVCANSIIGTATAKVDFGWPNSDRVGAPFEQFILGDGELIIFEYNQLGKSAADGFTVFPLIFRTPLNGAGFVMSIPEAPTLALPDMLWALKSVDLTFDGRGVFRTPATCAESGTWPMTMTFSYYMGVEERMTTRIPCRR